MVKHLWRFALVLFLVPVVIFSTPATSHALDAVQGPWEPASWTIDVGAGRDAHCSGSFSMRSDALGQVFVRAGAGYCRAGMDSSLWACQLYEPDCTEYRFAFEGDNCDSVTISPATRTIAEDSATSIHSGWSAGEALAGTCDPTQVCIRADSEGFSQDEWSEECSDIELDPPVLAESPSTECPGGTMNRPKLVTAPFKAQSGPDWFWQQTVKFELQNVAPGDRYNWYIVMSPDDGESSGNGVADESNGQSLTTLTGEYFAGDQPMTILLQAGFTGEGNPDALGLASTHEIVGMGYIKWTGLQYGEPALHGAFRMLPQENPEGQLGVTEPLRCTSYWGVKIAEQVDTTTDEPVAGLASGPPPETGPDDAPPVDPGPPEDDPPPADEPSFWSAILSVLRQIWQAVRDVVVALAGLGEAIASAILDGITELFVPDSVDMMDDVELTKDAWSETSLSTWTSTMTGQAFSMPSSGCNGIPVVFDLPGGVPVDMHLGAACSGPLANTAGIVKAISTGAIIIFGGFACLRALGSGFGWNPSVAAKGQA